MAKKNNSKPASKKVSKKKATKKTTQKMSKKKKAVEVTVTPPQPPVETTTTTTTTTTMTKTKKLTSEEIFKATVDRIEENYNSLITEVDALVKTSKALSSRLKKDRKQSVREVTQLYKKTRNDKKKNKQRKPSGFAKPCLISDELCEFLGEPKGTKMARTHVTSFITEYIKANNLQNPENKKQIILDSKLDKIIQVGPGEDPLTYFNIQKYMKHHYSSNTSSSVAAVV